MQGINMRRIHYISILTCVIVLGVFVYFNAAPYKTIKGTIFGTYYTVKIKTDRPVADLRALIETELKRIDQEMSVFITDSEISRINQAPKDIDIKLSPDMAEVLKAAYIVNHQSQGWFDPTLGKLIDLWGFGAGDGRIPSDEEISQAKEYTGFDKLVFSDDFTSVRKQNSATYLNLSAIAKGYGVDKVATLLEQHGFRDYLVEIGGEIKASGFRLNKKETWNIGINRPKAGAHDNIMIVSLSNLAVATSGNYRNFYKENGKIYGHTISYQTGRPILNDAISVSVFHNSCMYADAYATAIMAMGVDKGLEFADRYNLKVIIINNEFTPVLSQSARLIFEEN